MDIYSIKTPFIYFRNEIITLQASEEFGLSWFGGPGQSKILGAPHGPHPLHHIATLNCMNLGLEFPINSTIPFYFGFRYDGCELIYQYGRFSKVDIQKIDPDKSSDDWPYEYYPAYLPYYPIEASTKFKVSQTDFQERVDQCGIELEEDSLVFTVPNSPYLGISLWGPDGDANGVELSFHVNVKTATVKSAISV